MKLTSISRPALVLMLIVLSGCATRVSAPPEQEGTASLAMESVPTGFSSVDDYKRFAARHVMLYNHAHTFSGKLPAMLPAIVVLRITVDERGALSDVRVQRPPARDDGESHIAVASVRRAGSLPRPYNLASGPGRTLSYLETFLFNEDMRFQIRTLAPIQTAD